MTPILIFQIYINYSKKDLIYKFADRKNFAVVLIFIIAENVSKNNNFIIIYIDFILDK